MALNQDQVNVVCEAIAGAGGNPTLAAVRERLGTGSMQTIARMVRVWRGQGETVGQVGAEVAEAPEVIQGLANKLAGAIWAEANKLAEQRLAADRLDMEKKLAEQAGEMETVYQEMEAMQAELMAVKGELAEKAENYKVALSELSKAQDEARAEHLQVRELLAKADAMERAARHLETRDVARDQAVKEMEQRFEELMKARATEEGRADRAKAVAESMAARATKAEAAAAEMAADLQAARDRATAAEAKTMQAEHMWGVMTANLKLLREAPAKKVPAKKAKVPAPEVVDSKTKALPL